ncbi:MAG: terminase family protein [bacterium]
MIAEQRAKEHLIDFSILTNPKYKPNWHHNVIAEELETIEKFGDKFFKILLLFVPPRHGKSQEATINFPAWYLGRNPDKEIITACYSADLALDFGSKTRALVDDEIFRRIFDLNLKADEKAKAKWITEKGGSYTSVGIGGAITGRGANILIIDDPLKNREEANSELNRNKQWNWFLSTAYTRLEPNGVVIVILTRWQLDDLAGRILAHPELSKLCKVINFPAIALEDEKYRKKGEALWNEKYPIEVLEQIKSTLGPYEWSALYQQSPILTENQEFKQEWFKYRTREEVEKLNTRNYLTIDTAMSEKTSADFTGFCENYVDRENKWNLSGYRMRLNPKDLIDYVFTLHDKRSFEKIGIEKTAFTVGLKAFLDEEMRKRNRFLPIVELQHNQTQKEVRIRGLIPRYSSLSVYHIKDECNDLENELLTFPRSLNDDTSDATAYQLQLAEEYGTDFDQIVKQNEEDYIDNPYK